MTPETLTAIVLAQWALSRLWADAEAAAWDLTTMAWRQFWCAPSLGQRLLVLAIVVGAVAGVREVIALGEFLLLR